MRKIRGNEISMIFQEPMTSLNPVFRIGRQMSETIRVHQNVSAKEAFNRTVELLKMVGLSAPEKQIKDYPHQLSGGMRQRVMIAMALSCNPKLMLADEPTTALDVTIQAQILNLMNELKERIGTSIMLITHDLGVIAKMAQKVCIMYAGVSLWKPRMYLHYFQIHCILIPWVCWPPSPAPPYGGGKATAQYDQGDCSQPAALAGGLQVQ